MKSFFKPWRKRKDSIVNESGNVFATLFAAVAVVGVVGAGSVSLLKGPVSSMVSLNKQSITELRMEIASKLIMADAVQNFASLNNVDATEFIELPEYEAGSITGGGVIPASLGINDLDPWGTQFGYCTWDNGSASNGKNDAGTGTDDRLNGQDDASNIHIALVSAGPNRVFETGCYAYGDAAPEGLVKPSGSDDVIVSYDYTEATSTMGDMWAFGIDAGSTETVVKIDKNLDLRSDVSMSGLLTFNASTAGLVLPSSPGTTCTVAQEAQIFLDTSTTPPSLVLCNAGTVESIVAGGSAADTTTGLVAHYKLDESGNTSTASATVGPDGALTNYPGDTTDDWVTGHLNGGLDMDGTDELIEIPTTTTLNFTGRSEVSLSLWVDIQDVNTTDGADTLIMWESAKDGNNNETIRLDAIKTSGTTWRPEFLVITANGTYGATTPNIDLDSGFHHIVATYDGAEAKIYLNGALEDTNAATGTINAPADSPLTVDWHIGAGENTSQRFANGIFDDVRIYTRALEQADINSLYTMTGGGGGGGGGSIVANTNIKASGISTVMYKWGNQASGTPTLATGEAADFINVSGGWNQGMLIGHGCGLKGDGTVWCWGHGDDGRLGNSDTADHLGSDDYVQVTDLTGIVDIAAAQDHTCGLNVSGTVWCWGKGNLGVLGNNSTAGSTSPVQVSNITNFVKIDSGYDGQVTCGLTTGNLIYCWGNDSFGQLGDDETMGSYSDVPVPVANITDFVDVGTGATHACGLRKNGDVWCWGNNGGGQLGDGNTGVDSGVPVKVDTDVKFRKLNIEHFYSCGISVNNEIWCWGSDNAGNLGNGGSVGDSNTPVLTNDTDQNFIDAEGYCSLKADGKAYCWGYGAYQGDGTTSDKQSPTEVINVSTFISVSGGGLADAWGLAITPTQGSETAPTSAYDIRQQRNSGDTIDSHALAITRNSATAGHEAGIGFAIDATSIAGGDTLSAALSGKNRGAAGTELDFKIQNGGGTAAVTHMFIDPEGGLGTHANTAGANNDAILATGPTNTRTWNPDYYYGLLLADDDNATDTAGFFGIDETTGNALLLFSKDFFIGGVAEDGTGLQTIAYFISGSPVDLYAKFAQSNASYASFKASVYSSTPADTAMLRFDRYGGTSGSPSAIPSNTELGNIRFTAHDGTATDADGVLAIGAESVGAVGAGTVPSKLKISADPAGDPTGEDIIVEPDGDVGIGVATADSKLHVGGRGAADNGVKLGNDSSCGGTDEGTLRYTGAAVEYCDGGGWQPFAAGGGGGGGGGGSEPLCEHDHNFIQIEVGQQFTCGLYDNGRVACWGRSYQGYLGDGTTGDSYVPKPQIIPKTYVEGAKYLAAGPRTACAILSDGSMKCWGINSKGELGQGAATAYNPIPAPVVSLEKFVNLDGGYGHTCAVTNKGRVACWGESGNGRLGNNESSIDLSVPTYAYNVSNAVKVTTGDRHTCAVLKDGTVKCWGQNANGELGIGSTGGNYDIAESVSITDVIDITSGGNTSTTDFTCALKTDGTVWCWGDNSKQQLGNGAGADQNSPANVTTVSDIIDISAVTDAVYALKDDGTVLAWGEDDSGELGLVTPGMTTPNTIPGLTDVVALGEAGSHSDTMCFILADGTSQCMGRNNHRQIGNGGSSDSNTPENVLNPLDCEADKIMFVTSGFTEGDLGGIEGADKFCQIHADKENLPGTYYAWLSSDETSPSQRFNQNTGAYYDTIGTKIADDWMDLTDGTLDAEPRTDEAGTDFPWDAWTGTDDDGTALPNHCNGWTHGWDGASGNEGITYEDDNRWSDNSSVVVCWSAKPIYCFQQ